MVELKPCPFCGEVPTLEIIPPHKHHIIDLPPCKGEAIIECRCGAAIMRNTKKNVLEAWNRRA